MPKITILNTTEGHPVTVDVEEHVKASLDGTFTDTEIAAMLRYGSLIVVDPGTSLTVEGDVGGEAFIVVSGEADVVKDSATVATVGAGDIVGEHALITETRRNADVIASVATSLMAFTSREFGALLSACPELAASVKGLDDERE